MSLRLSWVLLALLPLVIGCVKAPGAEIKERMQIVEKERTPDRLLERARAFASVGDHTRAEQYLNAARDGGADEKEVVALLLDVCVRDQRYRDAIQYLESYLRRHPGSQRTRFVLATLEAAVGYGTQAEAEVETVVAAQPANAEAHYALAVVLRDDLGNRSRADEHFREYLKLRPAGAHAEEARGSLLTVIE